MALLDGGERVATVTAITDVELLMLHRDEFNEMLLLAMPTIAPKLLAGRGPAHPRTRGAPGPRDAVRRVTRLLALRRGGAPADPDRVALRHARARRGRGCAAVRALRGRARHAGSRDPAVFAALSLGAHADFGGPLPRRALRYAYAGLAALTMMPIGAALAGHDIALVVVTGLIVFVTMFLGTLGGPFFTPARFPVVLSLLFATTAGKWGSTLPERMLGWGAGTVAITIAAVVLWPLRPRTPATAVVADVCRAMAGANRPTSCSRRRVGSAPRQSAARTFAWAPFAADERIAAELVHVSEHMVAWRWVMRRPVEPAPRTRRSLVVMARTLTACAAALDGGTSGRAPRTAARARDRRSRSTQLGHMSPGRAADPIDFARGPLPTRRPPVTPTRSPTSSTTPGRRDHRRPCRARARRPSARVTTAQWNFRSLWFRNARARRSPSWSRSRSCSPARAKATGSGRARCLFRPARRSRNARERRAP